MPFQTGAADTTDQDKPFQPLADGTVALRAQVPGTLEGKEESTNAPFKIGILSASGQTTNPPPAPPTLPPGTQRPRGAAGSRPRAPWGAKSSQKEEAGTAKAKDGEALPSKEQNEIKGKRGRGPFALPNNPTLLGLS